MLTHVTRQGVRDHLGHAFHSAGEGEFTDGFKNIAEDGRLRSPLGVYLVEGGKEKAIAKFLGLNLIANKEEALKKLNLMVDPKLEPSGSYPDKMAVHFATEEVADCYYGSEKGNEIFIAYPSAQIASQYYFSGQLNQAGGGYWNDQWVWANEEKGISLNSGIVFIPEEISVDKETGSRYELDKEKNPVKNVKYVEAIRRLVDSEGFDDFAKQTKNIVGKLEGSMSAEKIKSVESLKPLFEKLKKDFDIVDPSLQRAVLDYEFLSAAIIAKEQKQENISLAQPACHSINSIIESTLKNSGIFFKETVNKVSSKDYWQTYFLKNIKSKPAHIVYYKGEDPTAGLNTWKKENGLNKKTGDQSIGFSENQSTQIDTPQSIAGMDRFKILAEKVIEDYYLENGKKD